MSEINRVFVTGLSALTACGETADATWQAVTAGHSGLGELTQWDLSSWTHRLGGELKQFQAAKMLPDRKLIKVISRQDALGICAAVQAVQHSQLIPFRDTLSCPDTFNDETAIYVGSPGNKYYQEYDFLPLISKAGKDMQQFADGLFSEVHPMWLLRSLPNNVLAYTGITYGFKGPNQNIVNHAVSGTQAILEAYHAIKSGQAARAIVVAYDLPIEPQGLFYYEKLGVISERHLKPFDKEHDGTLLAEGSAALVLESEQSALARQATCYAEIAGGMSSSEGAGLFSIDADGEQLAKLMQQLLTSQQLSTSDIDLVIAHGNGNPKSDITEAQAIQKVFTEYAVPVTAFKWAMGHTICTSGILDAVLACYTLKERSIPGISNLETLASTCSRLNASAQHREFLAEKPCILMINRGYASMNACLVIKACD